MISALYSLTVCRLSELDAAFENANQARKTWPQPLPDRKTLYDEYYREMQNLSHNIVCGSCGILGHHANDFAQVAMTSETLRPLAVDPNLVPFSFDCGILQLDEQSIMIDPLSIAVDRTTISLCTNCQAELKKDSRPKESFANYRWIGPLPKELEDLTWVEEALIARSHMFGRVFRLEERRNSEPKYSSLKGHVLLVPQDTLRLLDILPMSPDGLANIAHVVWVGRSEPDITKISSRFTVRKDKVLAALTWLRYHHDDYRNITIDYSELDKWPSVFVTEALLSSIGRVRSGASEDATRNGFATEEIDVPEFHGDIEGTASAILDTNNHFRPRHGMMLESLQCLGSDDDITINVVPADKILHQYDDPTYFTSAFPTLFPWGTGKHIDHRRDDGTRKLTLKRWTQLLLRNSSRYAAPW